MGLLDTITAMLGGKNAEKLQSEALQSMLTQVLGKDFDLNSILKNFDWSKASELLEFFQKNGVPDTKEEITELISKFNKK